MSRYHKAMQVHGLTRVIRMLRRQDLSFPEDCELCADILADVRTLLERLNKAECNQSLATSRNLAWRFDCEVVRKYYGRL